MSFNIGVMEASVVLNSKSFEDNLNRLPDKAENTFKKIASYAAAYLSLRQMSLYLANSVKAYSDLEEAANKFEVVFSGLVKKQREYVNLLKEQAGASNYSAMKMLGDTGDILTGFGFDREMALDMSYLAAQLGADLASFANYAGGAEGATSALTKAMLGETEAAKLLGIVIRQDDENYKKLTEQAMNVGLAIGSSDPIIAQTEQQAKAVAALAMAYQQSPNAIGDFVNTQHNLANQLRITNNNMLTTRQNIGAGLRDDVAESIAIFNSFLNTLNRLSPETLGLAIHLGALSASIAALSKFGILKSGNNFLYGLFSSKGGIKQKADAEAAIASERKLQAEAAKTAAVLELKSRLNDEAMAKTARNNALQAKMIVEARHDNLVSSGKLPIVEKQNLIKANNELAVAEANLAKATAATTAATQTLTAANSALAVATNADEAAAKKSAQATTVMGRAKIAASGAAKALGASIKSLLASLGPIGVAMLSIGALLSIISAQERKARNEAQGQINIAQKQADAAKAQAKANAEKRQEDLKHMERLQELSKYEKLNASEQEEAQKRIAILKERYKDLGIELDETTGKLNVQAEAWDRLTEKQREQALFDATQEAEALEKQINSKANGISLMLGQRRLAGDDFYKRNNQMLRLEMAQEAPLEDRLATYQELHNEALESNDEELASKMEDLIKDTEELIKVRDRGYAIIKSSNPPEADGVEKNKAEIDKSFSEEERSYGDYLAKREQERYLAGVDRQLDELERTGAQEQYQTMLSGLVDKYNNELGALKEDYRRTIDSAKQDGVMSDSERKAIADARRKIEETQSLADRYADRAMRQSAEPTMEAANATVAFSSEILSAMLGATTPQEETAENTKQMRSILQRMENKNSGSALKYGD
ncbi:MAG: hypothetical protein ACI4OV_02450 [Victivallaceae bacterium]